MTAPESAPPPSRAIPIALAGAALLVVVGGALFWTASQTATGPERGRIQPISVGQDTCDPASLTLPASRTTFEIRNDSDRTIEWEILDGVMVVAERENIAPGYASQLTVNLRPGSYEIICGLLSNPRGSLVVTPSAESEAARLAPPVTAFIGPLSEFRVFLLTQANDLVAATGRLQAAIASGDLDAARTAWAEARLPYKRMESVTGRIADLENAIDPLSDYLDGREADPAFTGFHRIEYGLWGAGGTDDLMAVADRLLADVTALKDRLRGLQLAPADLAGTAAQLADRLAEGQIVAGEDHWAGTDLAGIDANLDGIARQVRLLAPLVRDADPAVATAAEAAVEAARAALAEVRQGDAWPAYDTLDAAARAALALRFRDLAAAIAAINPAIGLE